jgi:hypothetical protein
MNLDEYEPVSRKQVDSFQLLKVLFVGRLLKGKGVKELIAAGIDTGGGLNKTQINNAREDFFLIFPVKQLAEALRS